MPKNIFPVANDTKFTATPEYDGNFVEFGTGSSQDTCGVVCLQFAPSADWVGEFIVMGRWYRAPAQATTAPFIPIPYIEVNVNGTASDRHHSSDRITSTGLIEVPVSGMNVGVLIACDAGSCEVYISRVSGTPVAL